MLVDMTWSNTQPVLDINPFKLGRETVYVTSNISILKPVWLCCLNYGVIV
jgi:hypothetical protein